MGDKSVERRRIKSMNGVERERKWEREAGVEVEMTNIIQKKNNRETSNLLWLVE